MDDRAAAPFPSRTARIAPEAVRAYDVRGVVDRHFGEAEAQALGRSYAQAARELGLVRIGVARDGRTSSPRLERALVAGLVEGGMEVERVGLGPTPMLAFAVHARGLDGGVMVTASHNPAEENGFKLMMGGERVHGSALKALVAKPGREAPGGRACEAEVMPAYVAALLEAAAAVRPLKVAWDCGNGSTGPAVQRLVARLPGEHRVIHAEVDGRFPNHHPDPAVEANLADLAELVVREGCDLGLAFDGDGDRIGVVDAKGRTVWADQLLLFLAQDLLAGRPGATVVADVKCSRVVFDGVARAGGRAEMAPSGYVLVREAMRRHGAALAGELSGHVFFGADWNGVDDALYAAVRVLVAVSQGRDLTAFRDGLPPAFSTPELRLPCPEPRKAAVVAAVAARLNGAGAEVDPALGLRIDTADGWWLLRASGTEAKLTCRCEADSPEGLERVRAELAGHLAACGMTLS
ncbi:phosphomannomutase/phosphoglucomutase [Caulobacter sp. 17J80-11]|uniref:phosphomannomutase/phosphoglucomutase n=1 Tax=Caulobacter sp. 17J80-11 TaxID=2763502 RepID=UPI001653C84E|nr:phosphomannomutase/phosphoglucomutase [Caulobacter sp. 17J80-11]MBC6982679.1 phosphomannomutase/phosphoglucomutase [Caulobacter sp. 17J80-11]